MPGKTDLLEAGGWERAKMPSGLIAYVGMFDLLAFCTQLCWHIALAPPATHANTITSIQAWPHPSSGFQAQDTKSKEARQETPQLS